MCRSARRWCVVTLLSPRKAVSIGLRVCVCCSCGNPTRRSVGFSWRCGTKAWIIHCSASDQLDEDRTDFSLGSCVCLCVRASENAGLYRHVMHKRRTEQFQAFFFSREGLSFVLIIRLYTCFHFWKLDFKKYSGS